MLLVSGFVARYMISSGRTFRGRECRVEVFLGFLESRTLRSGSLGVLRR
jgi:hypothetical protein